MTRGIVQLALVLTGLMLLSLTAVRLLDGQHGDPVRGAGLYYSGRLSCTACHGSTAGAPPLEGMARRVAEVRLAATEDSEETVALFLAESVIDPNRYVTPAYPSDNMPRYAIGGTFGLSWQNLNDLVAFLMTQ